MEPWKSVCKVMDKGGDPSTHPLVYVALGSHGNYCHPEVIRSPNLYHTGYVQRILYWADGWIHYIFLLFNPSEKARQIALHKLYSHPTDFLAEDAFTSLRDEADHYIVSLPLEIASGDGFRIGYQGDRLREGVVKSSSYLKRITSDRPVTHPSICEWQRILLHPEPEWVEYKGLWGVKSMLRNESGPPGPKWEHAEELHPPKERMRWSRPLEWLEKLDTKDRSMD